MSKEQKKTLKGRKMKKKERVSDDSEDDMTPTSSVNYGQSSRSASRSRTPSFSPSPTRSRTQSRTPTPTILEDEREDQNVETEENEPRRDNIEEGEIVGQNGVSEAHEPMESVETNIENERPSTAELGNDIEDTAREEEDDSGINHERFIYRNPFHLTDESISGRSNEDSNDQSSTVSEHSPQKESSSEPNLNVLIGAHSPQTSTVPAHSPQKESSSEANLDVSIGAHSPFSENSLNVSFASYISDCSVHCEDCGVSSEALDGPWVQLKDYECSYVCRKFHEEGLRRQEERELGLNSSDTNPLSDAPAPTPSTSNSSDTIPLTDAPTPPMSPVPVAQKRKRGRRPTYTQMNVTPVLTRSRSRALRQLGD